ncbi:MFS transporter [Lacticaseibacillus zhaodongensis]|uniref:MFS transporter n=1 Tax=Lacticaseibacillus zhaodongensis TaxID=2668065 RepID=UPI0012D2EF25|nr:MFS transporter [Lacticaseibacillus zhaodongensis]
MKKKRINYQLILSPFISQLGSAIFLLGLNWLLVKATGDTKLVGLVTGIGGIMYIVGDVVGASLVDHHDRKLVLIACDALAAAACLLGAWLITPANPQTWLLIFVTAVLDLMTAINYPAAKALTPDVIAPSALQSFNAIANTAFSMASVVAPMVGGLLLASKMLGFQGFMLVNAGSYFVAALLNASIKAPRFKPVQAKSHLIGDTISGLSFVFKSRQLTELMLALGAYNFCASGFLLTAPFIADQRFAGQPTAYSNFLLLSAVGGILGGILIATQKRAVSTLQLYLEQIVLALLLIYLGFHLTHPLWLAIAFISGFFDSQLFSSLSTLMQAVTPRPMLGRVIGLIFLVFDGVAPLSNMFFGQFIHAWNAHTYTVLGVLLIVVFSWLAWQAVRNKRQQPPVTDD